MKKIILHLCADIGSDSRYFQLDDDFEVVKIGKDIGVENYHPPKNVFGVIANPVCTEFSIAKGFHINGDLEKIESLYIRGNRKKPSLVYLHKNDKYKIKEWEWAYDLIQDDMSLRSMCSDGFAKAFYLANKEG